MTRVGILLAIAVGAPSFTSAAIISLFGARSSRSNSRAISRIAAPSLLIPREMSGFPDVLGASIERRQDRLMISKSDLIWRKNGRKKAEEMAVNSTTSGVLRVSTLVSYSCQETMYSLKAPN